MAENDVNVTDLVVTDDLIKGIQERPKSLVKGDVSGTEGITREEIRLPRLAIAQGLSDQMMPDNSLYIPELKLFEMFNDLTGEVYGRGPITFVPVRRDVRRIEFIPREEGGGIVDMNVPVGDPRLKWTTDPDTGKGVPPVATKFDEYVVMLLRPGKPPEAIVISIKHTNKFNRRAVDNFNTFIMLRRTPIYAGLYTIKSITEKNDQGTFGVPVIKNAGFLDLDNNALHKAIYKGCKEFADQLEGKEIVVDRQAGEGEGDASFDPNDM